MGGSFDWNTQVTSILFINCIVLDYAALNNAKEETNRTLSQANSNNSPVVNTTASNNHRIVDITKVKQTVGMTKEQVKELLGFPMDNSSEGVWLYYVISQDTGKPAMCDLFFDRDNNKVRRIMC